ERDLVAKGCPQSVTHAAFDLRADYVRIDCDAAVDRRDNTIDPEGTVRPNRDVSDHRNESLEAFMHRDATAAAFRQFLAIISFFGGEIEHAQMTRVPFQKLAAEFKRIFPSLAGEPIDHYFDGLCRVGVAYRAPPQSRHLRFRIVPIDGEIRHCVWHVGSAFDGCFVDAILDDCHFQRRADHKGLPDQTLLPGDKLALRV